WCFALAAPLPLETVMFGSCFSLSRLHKQLPYSFWSLTLLASASLLLPSTNDTDSASVARATRHSLCDGRPGPSRSHTSDELQGRAVARHAPDILEELQGFTRAEHEWQRVKADLAPVRLGHVDRKDELTTWTQDAVHLAQQGLVRFGRPAFIGSVRLGVLNRE